MSKTSTPARANVEALKTQLASAQAMAENSPINILVANTDLTITYANPASIRTLKKIERYLPCKAEEVVGKSIDIFHKNPAHQRGLLANPKGLPHRAVITLADQKLDLLVSPMYDDAGKYLGPMVTWEIVTEQLALQKSAAEKSSVVENAPINIMIANLDGVITYVNPASIRTLRKIERILPIPVDKIVGSSYDVFHKNPARQRQLLADPKNLPFSTEFEFGGEAFALQAAPLFDDQGTYVGPMVTWSLVTEQKAAAKREQELQKRERQAQVELKQKVDHLMQVVLSAANGDLTKDATIAGDDAMAQLGQGVAKMMGDLRSLIGQVVEGAAQFAEGAHLIAESSQSVAHGSQTQSASVDQMSTAVNKLTQSIASVKENAGEANRMASDTNRMAVEGGKAVQKSIEAMELIQRSSEQISEIIQVISEIASQTNLLALNAAIEAARAGEHGLGFAVVADEVRKLAERSSEAAKQISKLIRESAQRVSDGSKLSEETGEALQRIISGVESTAGKIADIATATTEQDHSAAEVAGAIQQVSRVTEQLAAASEEMASSSEELGAQAASLRDLVKKFKVE